MNLFVTNTTSMSSRGGKTPRDLTYSNTITQKATAVKSTGRFRSMLASATARGDMQAFARSLAPLGMTAKKQ
jgi:hypothetical protein